MAGEIISTEDLFGEPETVSTEELIRQDTPIVNSVFKNKSRFSKAYDLLKKPEELSRKGLSLIAESLPEAETTDVTTNMILNTPKLLTEIATEVAPEFVSPESIVSSSVLGASKLAGKAIRPVAGLAAKGLEEISGLAHKTPGILKEAFNDPSLLFGKGKKYASTVYESAKDLENVLPEFQKPIGHKEFVEQAVNLAEKGLLSIDEALEARKSLDKIKDKLTSVSYNATRDFLDGIAKIKFSEADKAYQQAVKSEAIRNIFPINKTGGASTVKSVIAGAGLPFGGAGAIFSPIVQGTAATAAGGLARGLSNPLTATALGLLNRERFENLKNNRQEKNR